MIAHMADRMVLGGTTIEWSDSVPWDSIPYITGMIPEGPGLYEVARNSQAEGIRLQIGKTIHLRVHLPDNLLGDPRDSAVGGPIIAMKTRPICSCAEPRPSRITLSNRNSCVGTSRFGCYPEYD